MRQAIEVSVRGAWPESDASASVTLDFDDRHRRRIRLTDDQGEDFLLNLNSATVLHDGDGLALEGGGYIRVQAALEAVADIKTSSPAHTARIAWHIGNRHTPVQVLDDATLRIRDDHVLVAMVEGLGAEVVRHQAAFAPEPGAYDSGEHAHDHA